ncbi:ABC-type antimicrobial peptide transport system, permease component [Desulfitobacterium dehalogenans ATCC 51507]|uniref:ABC-type antimicrobial peptide transport system, permease component n=1 Tax=Desulfitobacterium dehalogenans (strain ATCC 51507 / DSM 9161 / JW/IU-DC1) TaxID=756499 RepID=I4A7C6_DESDJ|nr:ABC transporter permease [Desulfitobacterium dehalogenans]AFL99860.1 ABC-type antimicrobial peptide transport system, permease component [Desulfitobacterium dehalogenans ATCC 51507]
MNFKECIQVAFEGIRANKMRSALTMLGIIIGVAAVITVVAIGQVGQAAIMSSLEKIGTNLFTVYPRSDEQSPLTQSDMITVQDLEVIKNVATDIQYVSPADSWSFAAQYERKSKRVYTYGVWPEYKHIRNIKLDKGRFLSEEDEKGGRRVVVIDSKLAEDLFGRGEALKKQINIFGTSYTVIGITQRDESFLMGGPNQPSSVYIPYSALQNMVNIDYVPYIEASAVSKDKTESAMNQAKKILNSRHHTENSYQAYSLQQDVEQIDTIMTILQLVIGSIAAISLLVGGIGVMNIMLVSVTERTREIGIRKALGAKYKDIMIQFLIEAVVICSIGGAIGALLGIGGGVLAAGLAKIPPAISPMTIVIAFAFSTTIGLFFGLYPARKAAKMSPVEALRYE